MVQFIADSDVNFFGGDGLSDDMEKCELYFSAEQRTSLEFLEILVMRNEKRAIFRQ